MRPHNVRVPLWDMLHAAEAIARFIEGLDFKDYERDLMLRSAVERQFEILGEAMTRARGACLSCARLSEGCSRSGAEAPWLEPGKTSVGHCV